MITNCDRENRGIGPDANPVTEAGCFPLVPISSGWFSVLEKIVYEHRSMRDETIVSYSDKLADKCVGLNSASLTNPDPLLNLDERPNEGIVTNDASVKIDRLDDRDILSQIDINNAGQAEIWLIHSFRFRRCSRCKTSAKTEGAAQATLLLMASDRTRRRAGGGDKSALC
jgi:hypothetical protein